MATVRINIADFGRALGLVGRRIPLAQTAAIRTIAEEGANVARRIASAYSPKPEATGRYLRSWKAIHYSRQSAVANVAPYSVYVEAGRRAGAAMPPIDAIRQWLAVKGLDPGAAFPVARAIARRGIRARPVLPELRQWLTHQLARRLPRDVRRAAEAGFRSSVRLSPDAPASAGGWRAGSVAASTTGFYNDAGQEMLRSGGDS